MRTPDAPPLSPPPHVMSSRPTSSRYVLALLVASSLAFACGPHSQATKPRPRDRDATPAVASAFDVEMRDGVTFALRVSNESMKHLELTFPNGRTHDFVVLDSTGREVWRWSRGRLFTQPLQNKLLGARQSVVYAESWEPGRLRGAFTAVAILASENFPIEQRVRFTVQ